MVFYRSDVWWNNVVLRTFTQQDWIDNFRMSKETFMYICNKLSPDLARTDTLMRTCLSVERRVAVTIWCLATPTEYCTIAHLFGIARSTVCEIVHETCRCIVDVLLRSILNSPLVITYLLLLKSSKPNGVSLSVLELLMAAIYQFLPQISCILTITIEKAGIQC